MRATSPIVLHAIVSSYYNWIYTTVSSIVIDLFLLSWIIQQLLPEIRDFEGHNCGD